MASFFGTKKTDTQQQQPLTGLRVQSSVQGKPVALLWGQNRIAGNLIWYGDFQSHAVSQGNSRGGKGGAATGGGGKGQQGSVTYTYSAALALALCSGPISSVGRAWSNKAVTMASSLGFETLVGSYTQAPWGYLQSAHPDQALNYRGLAYIAHSGLDLGSGTDLPNFSFEVLGSQAYGAPGIPDANPRDVVVDFLTNAFYGVPGWPASRLASLDQYAAACRAAGLMVSPVISDQTEASSFLTDLFKATNASPRWSSGKLDVIPWFDQPLSGNGAAYFPSVTPLYDLTNDHFILGDSQQPITSMRTAPSERLNIIRLEYLDRSNNYDPAVLDAKDQASIQQYGERPSDLRPTHFFCSATAAQVSAYAQLSREAIPNTYKFTLGPRFILIDVEDIVTLTRPELFMYRQAVRITEITENGDGTFSYVAEEYLGTTGAPLYGAQASAGYALNTNADPGGINQPLLFEPTDELAGGLEVWAAVCGQNPALWGGCNVYASYDGVTYQYIDRMVGGSRIGVLTAPLPAYPINLAGQTIDQTNVLRVDLSQSKGTLLSGSQADALALNTACYVDGEIIAYQTATLSGPNRYDINFLVRDAFGTETQNVTHPVGASFARLDSQILRVPYDQSRVGSQIFLKFQSFNLWGGGLQDIASLAAYSYTLTGSALVSPLPSVTNVRTVFDAGFTNIWWQEVEDFRQGVRYIIKKGDTYAGAQDLGTVAHPPFVAFGEGTYWIMPTCQPLPGLLVYGETPSSIAIQGNMLTANIIQTTDFQALGWPGNFTNVQKEGSDPTAVLRLAGAANILADPSVLTNPDIINAGGASLSGVYEAADVRAYLNVGYVADCYVNVTWRSAGQPIGADVLGAPDFLGLGDVLNAASSAQVEVWVEIRTALAAVNDMFGPADMFGEIDLFTSGIQWGAWQRYVPGVYRAQFIEYRVVFSSIDPRTIAYLTQMNAQVSIPARIDHYLGNSVPTGGLQIIFEPDDATTAKPFNGGPLVGGTNNHPLPAVQMSIPNAVGVKYVIDSLDLTQMTFHFEDGTGTRVAVSNVDVIVEGY